MRDAIDFVSEQRALFVDLRIDILTEQPPSELKAMLLTFYTRDYGCIYELSIVSDYTIICYQ